METLIVLFHLLNNSFERLGVVDREVSKGLAIDVDISFMEFAHQSGVAQTFETGCSIDALNPQSTEVAFLVTAVTKSISETLFPSVLGNGPNVLACAIVAARQLKNFLASCSRSNMIY